MKEKNPSLISVACGGETLIAIENVTHANAKERYTVANGGHGGGRLIENRHNLTLHAANTGFSHVSLGGNAALTYLSDYRLPGIEAISYISEINPLCIRKKDSEETKKEGAPPVAMKDI